MYANLILVCVCGMMNKNTSTAKPVFFIVIIFLTSSLHALCLSMFQFFLLVTELFPCFHQRCWLVSSFFNVFDFHFGRLWRAQLSDWYRTSLQEFDHALLVIQWVKLDPQRLCETVDYANQCQCFSLSFLDYHFAEPSIRLSILAFYLLNESIPVSFCY